MGRALIASTLLVVVLTGEAMAQTTTFRDAFGRETGTASTSGNVTTYRDRMGRVTGTAERARGGRTQFRDAFGREIGTASAPRR